MEHRTITIAERKSQLEALVDQSMAAQRQAQTELNDLQQKAAATTDRKALEGKYLDACRAEALGQENNRAQLEIDIIAIDARRKGFDSLFAEAQANIFGIENARGPIDAELRDILHQEMVTRETATIESLYQDAMAELQTRNEIVDSFAKKIATLREYSDPHLKSIAYGKAEELQRRWHGMTP